MFQKKFTSSRIFVNNCRIVVEGNRERKRRDGIQRKLYGHQQRLQIYTGICAVYIGKGREPDWLHLALNC